MSQGRVTVLFETSGVSGVFGAHVPRSHTQPLLLDLVSFNWVDAGGGFMHLHARGRSPRWAPVRDTCV